MGLLDSLTIHARQVHRTEARSSRGFPVGTAVIHAEDSTEVHVLGTPDELDRLGRMLICAADEIRDIQAGVDTVRI